MIFATLPNLLSCARFRYVCNLSNDVFQLFGTVHSSYLSVDNFNMLCKGKFCSPVVDEIKLLA
jgi:hypothetical protein